MVHLETPEYAKAFGLVIASGAATGVGAAVVFFPRYVKLANHKTLAGSLGFSAGVMLYVSLVDIYQKSIQGFEAEGHGEKSFVYTTICFFGGVILMKAIDVLIKSVLKVQYAPESNVEFLSPPENNDTTVRETETVANNNPSDVDEEPSSEEDASVSDEEEQRKKGYDIEEHERIKNANERLFTTGVATAAAIALHNLPEGMVTFVVYISDPAVGIALAVGIMIHNIPEGLCVAMPIFYATGNRCKAFFWGVSSGLSEPMGALISWLVLKMTFSGITLGIMFGMVAGIMTFLCIDDLLPAAFKHDPTGEIVTPCIFLGMLLLAFSMILFCL